MKTNPLILVLLIFLLSNVIVKAQISVNTDGSNPDESAMVDIKSNEKGLLMPRLTQEEIEAINNPASGLIVFNTDNKRFYFFDDSEGLWLEIPVNPNTLSPVVINPATGAAWMDRNLGAKRIATSFDDEDAYGDLYQWGRLKDGHEERTSGTTSTISSSDVPGHDDFILGSGGSTFDWRSPQNDMLWQGGSGSNNPCPTDFRIPTAAELDAERLTWTDNNRNGAFTSPLKLTSGGSRATTTGDLNSTGSVGTYWSSTIDISNAKHLEFQASLAGIQTKARGSGSAIRCIKDQDASFIIGGGGGCAETMVHGPYFPGQALDETNEVSIEITVTTPGHWSITTNTVNGYSFSGSGSFESSGTYDVTLAGSGTPVDGGQDEFTATGSNGGGTCIFYVSVADEVTNATTGAVWLDRNLGAWQVANAYNDTLGFGDLYQWGRLQDGHEDRNSSTTTTQSSSDVPGHGDFILTSSTPHDWRSPKNDNLWQGVSGINNPCPADFRIPTVAELDAERQSWATNDRIGAYGSVLKLPSGGKRSGTTAVVDQIGTVGFYWTSTIAGNSTLVLYFGFNDATTTNAYTRSFGHSVRCIKDQDASFIIGGGGGCAETVVNGPYFPGQALDETNEVSIEITVTTPGHWSITTNTVNGYSFSGSGTFESSGTYDVTLAGSGTPLNGGEDKFTATGSNGGGTCIFYVSVAEEVTNATTGAVWLDRNLGAWQVATAFDDTLSYGDRYQWGRLKDGHEDKNSGTTTTLSTSDEPGHGDFITTSSNPYDWRSPQNDNLWQGVNGTNNPCPTDFRIPTEAELEAERSSWSSNDRAGAYGSALKLPAGGIREAGSTSITYSGDRGFYPSSNLNGIYARGIHFQVSSAGPGNYQRANGFTVRCIKDQEASYIIGGGGGCSNTIPYGEYIEGVALDASNYITIEVTVTVPGHWIISTNTVNGYSFSGGGTFAASGTVVLTLLGSGTPVTGNNDLFTATANNGGGSCLFYVDVEGEVLNPDTGEYWWDRNIGADRVAISSTDNVAYGDLYQWGRLTDGHEQRTSGTTTILSGSDNPGHDDFILSSSSPFDWRSPQNHTLWQGVSGTNNPCRAGFRLPTNAEWVAEQASWSSLNAAGAYASPLKLPVAGTRDRADGSLENVGTYGFYWASTASSTSAFRMYFHSSNASTQATTRANGHAVRCIKD